MASASSPPPPFPNRVIMPMLPASIQEVQVSKTPSLHTVANQNSSLLEQPRSTPQEWLGVGWWSAVTEHVSSGFASGQLAMAMAMIGWSGPPCRPLGVDFHRLAFFGKGTK